MSLFLSSLFLFSTLSLSLPINFSPLSLSCNPSNQTNPIPNLNPIETLLHNLTLEPPKSTFSTSNATFGHHHYTALMQCRPGLSPDNCTLCANTARTTISNLCPNSTSVSAWFDGCYVQISSTADHSNHARTNQSCSARDSIHDPARYATALGSLFLTLRASAGFVSRYGFSYGQLAFQDFNRGEIWIYGLVECVRSVSLRECESCIEEAAEKLIFYCGGKDGGTLVRGACLARFDRGEFYHAWVNSSGGGGGGVGGSFVGGEKSGGSKEVVVELWGGGVACFLVFVLFVWFVRRSVLNRARVASSGFADFDKTDHI